MTKDRLLKYRDQRLEMMGLKEELEELEVQAYFAKAVNYNGDGGGSGDGDRMGRVVALLDAKRRRVLKAMERLLKESEAVEAAMQPLSSTEREVVRRRYSQGATWIDIAAQLNYSTRQVQRIHGRALLKMQTPAERAAAKKKTSKDVTQGHK